MAKTPYRGIWKQLRLAILQRDGYRCKLQLPGCTQHATAVDHIKEVIEGGAWHDPANLQAACRHCNTVKENERRRLHNHAATYVQMNSRGWALWRTRQQILAMHRKTAKGQLRRPVFSEVRPPTGPAFPGSLPD